jgi:hypothetical protein
MLQFLANIKGGEMKIISNIGGVRIEANSHKEFIALLTYAYRCKENHEREQEREIRLTRGEKNS